MSAPQATLHPIAAVESIAYGTWRAPARTRSPDQASQDIWQPSEVTHLTHAMPLTQRGPIPSWLLAPLESAPNALAHRLELFSDGSTRVTRHRGHHWERIDELVPSWEVGEVALSPTGRSIIAYVQRHANEQSQAYEAARFAAQHVDIAKTQSDRMLGYIAVIASAVVGTLIIAFAAHLSFIGIFLLSDAALLLHLWGVDKIDAEIALHRAKKLPEPPPERLTKESRALECLLRFDRLVGKSRDKEPFKLSTEEEQTFAKTDPFEWFAVAQKVCLPALMSNPKSADTINDASALMKLVAEEILSKIGAMSTRDAWDRTSFDERDVYSDKTKLFIMTFADDIASKAFETFVFEGPVPRTKAQ